MITHKMKKNTKFLMCLILNMRSPVLDENLNDDVFIYERCTYFWRNSC